MLLESFHVLIIAAVVLLINSEKYDILHISDIDGFFDPVLVKTGMRVGGIGRLLACRYANDLSMLFITGNFIRPPYSTNPNRPLLEAGVLALLKPTAFSLGSNEFQLDIDNFQKLQKYISGTISTSYDIPKTTKSLKHNKLVILSIAHEEYYNYPLLSTANVFHSPKLVEALNERINHYNETEETGLFFVAIGCTGITLATQIAIEVVGISVVISGCSRTMQWNGLEPPPEGIPLDSEYPLQIKNKAGKDVLIAHSYGTTKFVGKLTLNVDDSGELITHDGEMIYLDNKYPERKEADDLVSRIKGFEIAETTVFLNGRCAKWECNLGNLITDALVNYKVNTYDGRYYSDTSIALVAAKNIKSNIELTSYNGLILFEDLLYVINPHRQLVTIEIKGSALKRTLYISLEKATPENGLFLQVSGLHVRFDRRNKPRKRIVAILVRCSNCVIPAYSDLVMTRMYRVITTIDIFDGSSGHIFFANASKLVQKENITDFMALHNYLKQLKSVRISAMERIRIVKKSSASLLKATNCLMILLGVSLTHFKITV